MLKVVTRQLDKHRQVIVLLLSTLIEKGLVPRSNKNTGANNKKEFKEGILRSTTEHQS